MLSAQVVPTKKKELTCSLPEGWELKWELCSVCPVTTPPLQGLPRPSRGSPDLYCKLVFLSLYRTRLYRKCHMYFTQSCNRVMSNLYLAYFVPQGDFWELSCARGIELMITRRVFHQIVLCLNTPKINHWGQTPRV